MAVVRRLPLVVALLVALLGLSAQPAAAADPPRISEVAIPDRIGPGETLVVSWRVESEVGIGQYYEPGGLRPATWSKLGGASGWISWCGFPLETRQVSGSPTDGRYEVTCRIPDLVPNGSYSLYLAATDLAGAYADEQRVDFQILGGSSDGGVPIVSDVSVDSAAIPGRDVVLSWRATDETGVAGIVPWAFGPNGRVTDDSGAMWLGFASGTLVAGDARDGRYSVSLPLSPTAVEGTYTIWFSVSDVVGNRQAVLSPAGPGSVFATFVVGGAADSAGGTSSSGGAVTSTTLPGLGDESASGDSGGSGGTGAGDGAGGRSGSDAPADPSTSGGGEESLIASLVSSSRVQGVSGVIGVVVLGLVLAVIARGAFARRARRDA